MWLNNLSSNRKGNGEGVGSWFNNHLRREAGDGVMSQ